MTVNAQENTTTSSDLTSKIGWVKKTLGYPQQKVGADEIIEIKSLSIFNKSVFLELAPAASRYSGWQCSICWISEYQGRWIVHLMSQDEVISDHETIMEVLESKRQLKLICEEEFLAVAEAARASWREESAFYEESKAQQIQRKKLALGLDVQTGCDTKTYDERMKEQEFLKLPRWKRELIETGKYLIESFKLQH